MNINPATTLGPVHLTVSDLGRSLAYYQEVVGLRVLENSAGRACLGTALPAASDRGAAEWLLVLVEEPGTQPADGYSGLYHFALLLPEREDLARWLAHAGREKIPLVGAADHFVSEALYLKDPDHHGIEIYWDRPRPVWEGQVRRMGTFRLDVEGLLATLESAEASRFEGLPVGTKMGHIHLRVADLPATLAFYRDLLGFELMTAFRDQALFLAAGGYHHHIGANIWESLGAPQAPKGHASLRHSTLLLPSAEDRRQLVERIERAGHALEDFEGMPLVRDPSGNGLVLAWGPVPQTC